MRRLLAGVLLALSFCGEAWAAPGNCTNDPSLTVFANETITVSSTALGFTTATAFPTGADPAVQATCQVRADSIFSTSGGALPTATTGYLTRATSTVDGAFTLCGTLNLRRFRMIRQTTDATVYCEFSRKGDQ